MNAVKYILDKPRFAECMLLNTFWGYMTKMCLKSL